MLKFFHLLKIMNLTKPLFLSAALISCAGLLFGFDTAVISGVTSSLEAKFQLTKISLGWTVAIALVGTIVGAMFGSIPGDRWGRRDSLKITGVLFLLSAIGCAMAENWYVFMLSRFVGGIGIGAASVLAPMYIAEISPAKSRGRLVAMFQANVVLGILLAYVSNYIVGLCAFSQDVEWRVKLGVLAAPALVFLTGLFFVERSPRWLAMRGRYEDAIQTLKKLCSSPSEAESEFESICASLAQSKAEQAEDEKLFQRKYFLPIFLAFSIAAFNQLSGINALLYYLNDIFAMAGFGKESSDLQAVVIGATNMIFTILAMTVIDRFGRKFLLLVGSVGTAICISGVAAIFISGACQWLTVWLLIGYIAFFAFSQGAVIWVYISEVFPTSVRAKGQSLGSLTHWACAAAIAFIFPHVAELSRGAPFIFFALMIVLQFLVVLFVYPETKGLTLENMQKNLTQREH